MEKTLVWEVMATNEQVSEVLTMNKKRFLCRENSQQWNLKNVRHLQGGHFSTTLSQIRPRLGQLSHRDDAPTFFTRIGRLTQFWLDSFAKEVARDHYKNIVLVECINIFQHKLIPMRAGSYSSRLRSKMVGPLLRAHHPSTTYHQESMPKVHGWTGSRKYVCSVLPCQQSRRNKVLASCDNAAKKSLRPELM